MVISRAEALLYNSQEIPISAAIAIENEIISIADNQVQKYKSPLMHAEFIAVQNSLHILKEKYLDKASIYVNLEPCYLCTSILKKVRIKEIFFGAYSPKTGAIVHGERMFDYNANKTVIIGGIQEIKCSNIISVFFKNNIVR